MAVLWTSTENPAYFFFVLRILGQARLLRMNVYGDHVLVCGGHVLGGEIAPSAAHREF